MYQMPFVAFTTNQASNMVKSNHYQTTGSGALQNKTNVFNRKLDEAINNKHEVSSPSKKNCKSSALADDHDSAQQEVQNDMSEQGNEQQSKKAMATDETTKHSVQCTKETAQDHADVSNDETVDSTSDNAMALSNEQCNMLFLFLQLMGFNQMSSSQAGNGENASGEGSTQLGTQEAQMMNLSSEEIKAMQEVLSQLSVSNGSQTDTTALMKKLSQMLSSVNGIKMSDEMTDNLKGLGKELKNLLQDLNLTSTDAIQTGEFKTTFEEALTDGKKEGSSSMNLEAFMNKLEKAFQVIAEGNPEFKKLIEKVAETSTPSAFQTNSEAEISKTLGASESTHTEINEKNNRVDSVSPKSQDQSQAEMMAHKSTFTTGHETVNTDVKNSVAQDFITKAESQQNNQLPRITQAVFGQIVQKAKLISFPDVTEMKIQLKPDFLGKLDLNVKMENGSITAKFNADNPQVKAILEANLNTLKDALSEQGIKVDQLVVDVGADKNNSDYREGQKQVLFQQSGQRRNSVVADEQSYDYDFGYGSMDTSMRSNGLNDYYGNKVNFIA